MRINWRRALDFGRHLLLVVGAVVIGTGAIYVVYDVLARLASLVGPTMFVCLILAAITLVAAFVTYDPNKTAPL